MKVKCRHRWQPTFAVTTLNDWRTFCQHRASQRKQTWSSWQSELDSVCFLSLSFSPFPSVCMCVDACFCVWKRERDETEQETETTGLRGKERHTHTWWQIKKINRSIGQLKDTTPRAGARLTLPQSGLLPQATGTKQCKVNCNGCQPACILKQLRTSQRTPKMPEHQSAFPPCLILQNQR